MSTRDTIYEPISRQMKRLFKTIVSKNFENIFSTFNISIFPGKVSDRIKYLTWFLENFRMKYAGGKL